MREHGERSTALLNLVERVNLDNGWQVVRVQLVMAVVCALLEIADAIRLKK
jgi:hypothetical protein